MGGIDAVLLVVAADEGVMPQTREHLDICRLLAVPRGVIAITKADLVDPEMLDLVQLDVAELVAGTALSNAPVIPVSATTGVGIDALKDALASLAAAIPLRDAEGATRLPVDRVFSMRGFGTVATGTLTNGRLAVDDALEVMPGGRDVKVRGVQVHGARRQAGGRRRTGGGEPGRRRGGRPRARTDAGDAAGPCRQRRSSTSSSPCCPRRRP